ncbi:MAG: hypothetical protein QGG54_11485, partial [Gammaproteobacteria bacterium]|nr:hypothetical protein [Gammaproteobacteria bacterium]
MALLRFAGLISLCLLLLWQPVLVVESSSAQELREESALETSTRLQQQIALFDEQIIALESEFGPFHQALLEPLQGLTDLHIEAGDFEEVSGLLNRRLQLLHTLEGPSTLNQITVLTELISNDIRLQRWGSVTDRFELIHLLHTQNPEVDATTRLASLEELRTWHQAAVYADEPRRRVTHFLESREIQKDIISRAEREFGENGVELIPWLYGYAVDQHRIKAFLSSTDELGHAARRDIARREARGQISYLREGFNVVERIQEIVETLDNPEAEAMAKLYVADFQLLMREYSNSSFGGRVATRSRGNSASTYRDAMEMLQEAGIDQAKIDAFFQRPVVLPISEYYLSLDA